MKTMLTLLAVGALGLMLSQEPGQAQTGKRFKFDSNAKATATNSPAARLTPANPALAILTLESTVSDLQDSMAKLKQEVASLKSALNKTNAGLESVNRRLTVPKGYTTQYITKTNFDRVEGSALMKFYVRY